jgi:plastocyanin
VKSTLAALVVATAMAAGVAPAAAYEEAAVDDGGTLTGVVRFVGRLPGVAAAVTRSPEVCGEQALPEALVVSPSGGVRGSVVMIHGVKRGKKAAPAVVLDTQRCAFVAHVSTAMPGERVEIRNADPLVHNARGAIGRRGVFNVALPGRDQVIDITKRLTEPGVVRVVCEAHPHMLAWIVVHDSPYATVTDDGGTFRIDGIPPGAYRVAMWHEGFRARGVDRAGRPQYEAPRTVIRQITIAPRASATLDFELR